MSSAHIHLLLNHIPILGTIFALLLLLYGMVKRSDDVKRASLGAFLMTALLTIPVYLTGDGTAEIVQNLPGVSIDLIRRHDNAATITIVAIELLGAISLLSLWLSRRATEIKGWMTLAVLILALISSGLAVWTGGIGGQIRHTEVRASNESTLSGGRRLSTTLESNNQSEECAPRVSLQRRVKWRVFTAQGLARTV